MSLLHKYQPPGFEGKELRSNLSTFPATEELLFSCYGARISIFTNDTQRPSVLDALRPLLPPGWQPIDSAARSCYYLVDVQEVEGTRTCTVFIGPEQLVARVSIEEALDRIAAALHVTVSCHASELLFVHAGAVGWNGHALVIPGVSHSGKTSLVKALVKAGATYYSDEFAVLDHLGRVHPYPRPLSVRDAQGGVTRQNVASLGGTAGTEPLPVGMILSTHYEAGAAWKPRTLTAGQAALRLLENTVLARRRSEQALRIFERVMHTAVALQGARGEATALAPQLLQLLEDRTSLKTA